MSYKSNNERRAHRARAKAEEYWKKLEIGKRYRVMGWHTGNFTGEAVSVHRTFAVLRVVEKSGGCTLEFGQEVEIPTNTSHGHGAKIVEAQF